MTTARDSTHRTCCRLWPGIAAVGRQRQETSGPCPSSRAAPQLGALAPPRAEPPQAGAQAQAEAQAQAGPRQRVGRLVQAEALAGAGPRPQAGPRSLVERRLRAAGPLVRLLAEPRPSLAGPLARLWAALRPLLAGPLVRLLLGPRTLGQSLAEAQAAAAVNPAAVRADNQRSTLAEARAPSSVATPETADPQAAETRPTADLPAGAATPRLAGRSRWASSWLAWDWRLSYVAGGVASTAAAAVSSHPSLGSRTSGGRTNYVWSIRDHRLTCALAARHTFALDHIAPVAQLDRASAYEAGGRLFESGRARCAVTGERRPA